MDDRVRLITGDCRDAMRGMDPCSVDAVVTDPPYGLSFMGKDWDHGVPGEAFWTEAMRVAKPGAHLLAFGGTRTFHRLACAIEDAGWEIRDCVMWLYGSGFPKSLDVGKAIDRMDASEEQESRRYRFTAWVRSQGVTAKQIDEATGTCMGNHYTTHPTQPAIMTREHLEQCRHLFRSVPAWVERECDIRSVESRNMAAREVVGRRRDNGGRSVQFLDANGNSGHDYNITSPATDLAKKWHGWGTALKPAWEPVIVARKPLDGTVAANVLKWGTGAVNVDGCRVHGGPSLGGSVSGESAFGQGSGWNAHENRVTSIDRSMSQGRWPANFLHDGSEEVLAGFPQTGAPTAATTARRGGSAWHGQRGIGSPDKEGTWPADTGGSAACFFYCAKASKRDRDEGLEGFEAIAGSLTHNSSGRDAGGKLFCQSCGKRQGACGCDAPDFSHHNPNTRRNHHPTVKPTDLMRYLCRLVTPPDGVVLDPFMGSGSTGKAAVLEGFRFIGIDLSAEYVEIARARIAHAESNAPLYAEAC